MRSRMFIAAALIAALAVPGAAILAQQQVTPKPAQSSAKKETVDGRADYMRAGWGAKKATLMKGNVKFTHTDTVLTSDVVEYDEQIKTAVSPGKLHIVNPECDITGDKGSAYFKKRLGVVEGNVLMLVKPKQTETTNTVRSQYTQNTTITCSKLEYLYKDKIATAIGGVVFKQDKRTASADKAIYEQSKELLTLTGNVKSIDEQGQTFSAPGTVVISLKKGDEWIEAKDANASFKIELDDESEQ